MGYTGKATNAICAKCLEDPESAEVIWCELGVDSEVPGIEQVTVQLLSDWAKIRDICYAKPPSDNWIEELQDTIDDMRLTWRENRYPVVLLIHVLFSHLPICAKYHPKGFWSLTEEMIEASHGIISRESIVSHSTGDTKVTAVNYMARRTGMDRKTSPDSPRTPRPKRKLTMEGGYYTEDCSDSDQYL